MSTNKPKKSLLSRILKWTGISVLVLLVLLIAAPFMFKGKIVQMVKDETNAALLAKVDFGDFDLSIISSFPDFRFKIQNVSVVGMGDFEGDTLAAIGELSTDINLKSVISGGPYKINSIVLDKARINAIILKDGRANWDIAKPDTAAVATPEDTSTTAFSLKLKELVIKDAYIVYDDKESNMYAKLEDLDYTLTGDFTQDNFVMNNLLEIAKTTYDMDGINYLKNASTKFKAEIDMDMLKWKFTFKENELSINDLALGFDGYVLMPDTNIDMDLKFDTKKADFKSILSLIPSVYAKDFESVKTSGKLALNGMAKGRYNAVQMPAFALNLLIQDAMFKYPSLPKSVNNIQVDVKINNPTGDLDATVVDVNRFHLEMAGNPIDMMAHITTPMSDPGIKASLKGAINLASVKEFVPLEKGDNMSGNIKADIAMNGHMSAIEKEQYDKFNAQGTFEIDKMLYNTTTLTYSVYLEAMKLSFTNKFVELNTFNAMLGKSDVQANGRIDNMLQYMFKDELIKGSFAINSRFMDLNELMGPETPTTAADSAAAATATTAVTEVPANMDFNLDAKIGSLLYSTYTIEALAGNIVVRDQKVDMTNLKMGIIGGMLTMNGYYETTNIKKPSVAMSLKLENFDVQTTYKTFVTMQKLAPIGQYAKGTFTATIDNFKTTLNDKMEPDLNAVDAKGIFKTNNVSVGGFPPFVKLGDALKIEQLKNMTVNNVVAPYFIKNGRINLEPFDVKVAGINCNIAGSTGLDQTIDYTYKMEIPRAMFGSAANSALTGLLAQANQKAGTNVQLGDKVNVTAKIGGTVTNPVVKTGLKGSETQSAVGAATVQALNAGIDKANEEAQKILEDAKAQVEKLKAEAQVLSDKTRQEGYANADKMVEQANNPIAKAAAKKGAELAKKEVDKKAQAILDEADKRGQKILEEAKVKADAKAASSKK